MVSQKLIHYLEGSGRVLKTVPENFIDYQTLQEQTGLAADKIDALIRLDRLKSAVVGRRSKRSARSIFFDPAELSAAFKKSFEQAPVSEAETHAVSGSEAFDCSWEDPPDDLSARDLGSYYRAQKTRIEAHRVSLMLRREKNELIPVEMAIDIGSQIAVAVQQSCLAIIPRVAPQLIGCTDINRITDILERNLREALRGLSLLKQLPPKKAEATNGLDS
jgi:hypothetical protein